MSPELKAKWLAALRSGTYKQGHQVLRSADNKYCCLGVLCEVAVMTWSKSEDEGWPYTCEAGQDYIENDHIRESLGLDEDVHRACFSMNDGSITKSEAEHWNVEQRGYTFAEIADWLEKHL